MTWRHLRRGALAALVWAVVAVPVWWLLLGVSAAHLTIAGHDAVVKPTLDGYAVIRMGPYLPDARMPAGGRFGVEIVLGKTDVSSPPEIIARYAALAAQPEGEISQVRQRVEDLVVTAAVRAAVIAMVPWGVWLLLGTERRRQLRHPSHRTAALVGMLVTACVVVLVAPWRPSTDRVQSDETWTPLAKALPSLAIPADLAGIELQGGALTATTTRLVESGFDTYAKSRVFYTEVRNRVDSVAPLIRVPKEGDTVGVLVSDRHDNVGMDPVAAALGRAGGATVVLDAGDDTSTGGTWEAFSLDSLDQAFAGYEQRVGVAGNHDNGGFVVKRLRKLGWTTLDGSAKTLFGGVRLLGIDDPRSSGLGNWRDEKGLSFAQVSQRFSDELCRLDREGQRVATALVHDANLAKAAVRDGCVDLVVAGHLHTAFGPTRYVGADGQVGYSYTTGTTGGAAYAMALGSKLRRDAMVTLITWHDGRPIGIQAITIRTTGDIVVEPFLSLTY